MKELIDYSMESTEGDPIGWTHSAFKKYFIETYWKIHKTGGAVPWRLKETTLLSMMMTEYQPEDLMDMIVYWHTNTPRAAAACQFTNFYADKINIYEKMKKATSDYSWD